MIADAYKRDENANTTKLLSTEDQIIIGTTQDTSTHPKVLENSNGTAEFNIGQRGWKFRKTLRYKRIYFPFLDHRIGWKIYFGPI